MDEADIQKIEAGIFADTRVKEKPFLFRGKEYTFKITELPWVAQQKIMSNCLVGGKSGAKVDISAYNTEMLLRTVKDTDGLFSVDRMTIMKLSDEIGDALEEQIIPNPSSMGGMDEEDSKN